MCHTTFCLFTSTNSLDLSQSHFTLTVWALKLLSFTLRIPLLGDYQVTDLFRFFALAALNIVFGLNKNEYSTDYKLYGWLTIANAGLALLLAARSNLFSLILRLPSPVLLQYHRWIGLATVTHATTHITFNIMQDVGNDAVAASFEAVRIQVGLLAWICLALMLLTALPVVRRRFFEVFYYTHFLFFVFMVGALYHTTNGPEFLLPGFSLWVVDRLIRFAYNFRRVDVQDLAYFEGDLTKLQVKGIRRALPGQIVWIQIRGVSLLNWHPFTVANVSNEDSPVTTIAIRGLGGFTKAISELSGTHENTESLRVRLDGPYGVGRFYWPTQALTVLIAGGVGITPGLSIASSIISNARDRQTAYPQQVHLLWIVKDPAHISWFAEDLSRLEELSKAEGSGVIFRITAYATQAQQENMDGDKSAVPSATRWKVNCGRPDLLAWVGDVKQSCPGVDGAVNVCGPRSLIRETRNACRRSSDRSGMLYVEEEVFEL